MTSSITTTPASATANTTDQQGSPAEEQQPAAAPANPETTKAFSITSFVLGLASVVSGWTFIVPLVGLVLGVLALRRNTSERTLTLWGVWLNAAMLALSAIVVIGAIILITVFAWGSFALPEVAVLTGF